MNSLFDQYGNLNIDDLIAEQPSFQKIMEDGIVTAEEVQKQSNRISSLLHKFEETATPDQIEQLREILAELAVLVSVNNQKVEKPDEQVYHCSECGAEFHKHDVFCPNPKCGKLITYMDYQE